MKQVKDESTINVLNNWKRQDPNGKHFSQSHARNKKVICTTENSSCHLLYKEITKKYYTEGLCTRGNFCTELRIFKNNGNLSQIKLESRIKLINDFTVFQKL